MKICPKCRSQFPDSEAFCENCGGALEQAYVPPVNPDTAAAYQSTGSAQTASDGKKTLLITVVIIMSVLILALIAVILWFIASPSKDDGIQETIDADQAYVVTDITTNTTDGNDGFNFIENTATTTLIAATTRTETTAVSTEATTVKKTAAETKKTTKKTATTTKKTKKTTTTTKKTKKTTTTTTTAVTTAVTTVTPELPDAHDIIAMLPSDVSVCASYIEDGHTYFMVMGEKSWSEAAEICEELGGYLAAVETESEQKRIEEFIGWMLNDETYPDELRMENVWLGGYFDETDGEWKWVNDAPFDYTNWDSWNNGEETFSQPDNYTGDEFYLRLATMDKVYESWIANAGKWNDTANEADGDSGDVPLSSFGFIIEFDFEAEH